MRTLRIALPALTSACLMVAVAASAQDDPTRPVDDQTFVKQAASGGLFEVQSSQIAQQKSNDAQVKQFAQRMILDHTKANNELIQTASAAGIPVARTLLPKHQMMIEQLSAAPAGQFDDQYWTQQAQAHEETVALFENASKNVQDAQLKAFATKTLPILREHLKMARDHTNAGQED